MRLHAGPGRGGRGLPWLVKPKYLLQKPLYATLQKDYVDPNNFYGVLESNEENKVNTNAKIQCIEGLEDKETCRKKQTNLYDQRKMCEKIPNSKNLPGDITENRIAPEIVKKTFEFTTVVRKKRKKKYNIMSPAKYYKNQPIPKKLESHIKKSVQENKCWDKMPMTPKAPDENEMMENVHTQDIDMEVDNREDDSIRNGLWNEIKKISEELNLPMMITKENSMELLEDTLEKLKSTKVIESAFSKTTQVATKHAPPTDNDETLRVTRNDAQMITPDGKKTQKNAHGILVCNLEAENERDEVEREHDERKANMIQIIKEVSDSIKYNISKQEEIQMQSWDMVQLRKKLGDINVCKKKSLESSGKRNTVEAGNLSFHKNGKEQIYDTEGLNVAAVSDFITPREQNVIDVCKPPEVEQIVKNAPTMKHQMRHSYTARLRLHVTDTSVNVGLMLKKMYQLWKETDPSAMLLAHAEETNNALMIDDINKIPSEEKEVNRYVMPGMFHNKGKLHMSLRLSGHLDLPTLKKKIFAWMGHNRSFATIDRVQAALVHTIGFLHYIHPDFYNREDIKKDIKTFLAPLNIDDDVNVFARKIWMRDGEKKIETRAMVVEVPKDHRDEINHKLMEFKLDNCNEMTYIPFSQMADPSYNSTLKEIFLSQNVYLHRTQRRNIYGVLDPRTKFNLRDGTKASFCEWIESITYGNEKFLDACVVGPTGTLHLIYDEEKAETVQQLFGKGFKEHAQDHFDQEDLKQIFGSEEVRIGSTKNKSSKQSSAYAEFLKRKFQGNPQDSVDRRSDTLQLSYADASRAPPLRQGKMNLHYSKFSESSPIVLNVQNKKAKIDDEGNGVPISKNVELLMSRIEQLETNSRVLPTAKWEDEMDRRLTEKMNQFKLQFDDKLEQMEEQTDQRLRKSEQLIVGKLHEMQIQNTENINTSFTTKMNQMGNKLDTYMTIFMAKIESTSAIEHNRSAFVTGKCD